MKKILTYLFWLLFPLIIGFLVGLAITGYIDYNSLIKPPLAPPSMAFPIAWTIIYLLLGISYFIYRKNNQEEKTINIYYIQLFVNALWSIIFFVLKWRFISIIWIILLLGLIIYLFYLYSKSNKTSAYLLIPYIIWVVFATYLNIGIYILN